MAQPEALHEVLASIQNGTITKDKISQYFEIDAARTAGMSLVFKLKPDAVSVTSVSRSAYSFGHDLALDAERAVQKNRLQTFGGGRSVNLIAIGDSWFSHPLNTTVIDVLQQRGHAIDNMAVAGQTLEEMILAKEYLYDLSSGKVTHFLFSGGGNDVIGRLADCVSGFDIDHANPDLQVDVAWHIKSYFAQTVLPEIKSYYRELISDVAEHSPTTRLVLHGYGYARPAAHGVYLGEHFSDMGFDLLQDEQKVMTWRIVMKLLDQFNLYLAALAAASPHTISYVDLRPVVRQSISGLPGHRSFGVDADWYDYELHPSPAAANRMADAFSPVLPALAIA